MDPVIHWFGFELLVVLVPVDPVLFGFAPLHCADRHLIDRLALVQLRERRSSLWGSRWRDGVYRFVLYHRLDWGLHELLLDRRGAMAVVDERCLRQRLIQKDLVLAFNDLAELCVLCLLNDFVLLHQSLKAAVDALLYVLVQLREIGSLLGRVGLVVAVGRLRVH